MSQTPPGASDGWYDPYGAYQPGLPPPEYWLANDGRWYPPNPQAAPTPPAPQGPPPQGQGQYPPGAVNPAAQTQVANPAQFAAPQAPAPSTPPPAGPPPGGAPPGFASPAPSPFEPPQASVAPPGQYAPPPNFAPPQNVKKSRGGLIVALAVTAAVVIFGGVATLLVLARNSDDEPIAVDTTIGADGPDPTLAVAGGGDDTTTSSTNSSVTTEGNTATTAALAGGGEPVADVVGCTVIDEDSIEVELVNGSSSIQSYFLTVAFFEGDERLGDTIAFINNLRPGERTIESSFIFDQAGSRCEVIESDTFSFESEPAHLADISTCEITGADFFDDVTAELSATNSSASNADYSVEVALIDADGVRRGTGFATIEAVQPGQSAPSEVFTSVDAQDNLVCEVVSATRLES